MAHSSAVRRFHFLAISAYLHTESLCTPGPGGPGVGFVAGFGPLFQGGPSPFGHVAGTVTGGLMHGGFLLGQWQVFSFGHHRPPLFVQSTHSSGLTQTSAIGNFAQNSSCVFSQRGIQYRVKLSIICAAEEFSPNAAKIVSALPPN